MTISCLCIFLCSYNPAVIFQILKLREKILTILNYAKLLQYLLWQPVSPKEPSNKMQKNQELACCCCCCYIASVVSDSVRPYRRQPTRLCRPGASPGKNTGVGYHALLQGIFLTQGSNPGLPQCRQILYPLSHQGSP